MHRLLARLARTEEAAKRKMRLDIVTASGVRSGGNVALQFAAEQVRTPTKMQDRNVRLVDITQK